MIQYRIGLIEKKGKTNYRRRAYVRECKKKKNFLLAFLW